MISLKKSVTLFLITLSFFSCSKKDDPGSASFNGKEYSQQTVGQSAHDLLSADPFTSLKINIRYMPGYKPDESSVSRIKSFLNSLLHKPGGISITEKQIPSSGKSRLSLNDVVSIEQNDRTGYAHDREIDIYLLYTDADYTNNEVLGFA